MLVGAADATVAVPESAQAVVAAALAAFTERAPLLVVTATGLDAERLGDDLTCLLAAEEDAEAGEVVGALAGAVAVLPAWETLPFERVSPEIETMGRRLALLHALTGTAGGSLPAPPRVIVAPVRALLQRLGPLEGTAPLVIRRGERVDEGTLLPELVARGYRREHQVEHRGEFAVRGGIVDVFPSTADEPVRIDLWGDEVDRLTAFSVSDQRSTHDLTSVALFGCRELVLTAELREAAASLGARRPWGASVWERLERGEQFDGMESWLPFLDRGERVLPDLLPPGGPGGPGRAAADPRPGGAAARRGGRAGRDARRHLGGQGRRGGDLPPPAPALRPPAARVPRRRRLRPAGPRGPVDRRARRSGASSRWRVTPPAWPPGSPGWSARGTR